MQHRDATAFTKPWSRVYVHHLSVADAARRQGVGTALMDWAEARASEKGIKMLILDHWAANPIAKAFYDHLGFDALRVVQMKTP